MKFTIMAGELADSVGWVSHALPKRAAVPVLNGILVEADGDSIALSAYDYDTSRQIRVDLDAPITPGRALLPGRILGDVAKAFPRGELVDVAVNDRRSEVKIECGRSEYALLLMPVDDYPSLPAPPAAVGSVAVDLFAAAVAQAAVAAGTDDATPQLTGVRFEVGDGLVDLAATDRYQMTWRTLAWTPAIDAPAEVKALIPAKVLADVARGLPSGASVEVCLDGTLAAFVSAGRCTTVRLLENAYIDFRAHFTKLAGAGIVAEFDAAALVKVVKRVGLMAERNAPVRLAFTRASVLVKADGGDVGRGCEEADAVLDGDDIEIAFNPSRLASALASFGSGTVQLRMTKPEFPAVLGRAGDDSYRHLVMAIRLS